MTQTKATWLLRIALPVAGIGVSLLCGRSLAGSVGMVFLAAFLILLLVANPLVPLGFIFAPLLGLYGIRFCSRNEPDMDLRDSDIQLFLFVAVPLALLIVALLSLYVR